MQAEMLVVARVTVLQACIQYIVAGRECKRFVLGAGDMARKKGSTGITRAEEQTIRLGLQLEHTVPEIAKFMKRTPDALYKKIRKMKKSGAIDQLEMPRDNFND